VPRQPYVNIKDTGQALACLQKQDIGFHKLLLFWLAPGKQREWGHSPGI